MIWNLVSNAVKFTPRGGRVDIVGIREGDAVIVKVSDTGVRFRQADARFTREHGGLGLGLAIARHLVEMHGGTITASSDGPGRGATFRIRLPQAAEDRSESTMLAS